MGSPKPPRPRQHHNKLLWFSDRRLGLRVSMEASVWAVLELLAPYWMALKWSAIPVRVRDALCRRKWAEFRAVIGPASAGGFVLARLLKEGIATRDLIYISRARKLNRKLWGRE